MVRRVDRIKDIRGQALRTRTERRRGRTGFLHRSRVRVGCAGGGGACRIKTSRMSLARRIERDPRLPARAANWLFIKGGIVILFILGLMVLGSERGIFR